MPTNANGIWSQSGFEEGTTYVATPNKEGYVFEPQSITFTSNTWHLNLDFNGPYILVPLKTALFTRGRQSPFPGPTGASVVISVNGVAEPAVVANDGIWRVSGLSLKPGDTISVTAQCDGETVSTGATTTVA